MKTRRAYVWKNRKVVNWTRELDALLGTMPDAALAKKIGFSENAPHARRIKLGIQSYRTTRTPGPIPCANCGKVIFKKRSALSRSKRLFCDKECSAAGQKRRDSETLRYGKGWKNRRAEIRKRDRVCRACKKTVKQNGQALHVHHLKPYRFGGTNRPTNLIALCDSCHHITEAVTNQALELIQVSVRLVGSCLTITADGKKLWRGSVVGVDFLTPNGLVR